MTDALASRLVELLTPVVAGAGLLLETVEVARAGHRSTVRVVVDLPDGQGDVGVDDIAGATRAISEALDRADPVKGRYTLEVSSPGAERELSAPRHFRRAVGRDVRLTTGAGEVTGTVLRADGESVTVDVGGHERVIAYADLVGARMLVRL